MNELENIEIQQLRDAYYQGISNLTLEEDIIAELPKPEYNNFYSIMEGIIKKLNEDYEIWSSIENDEDAENEREILKFKLEVCQNRLEEAKKTTETEEKFITNPKKRDLIFATTESGNIYIEKDLKRKDFPEEKYSKVSDGFYCIETYDKNNPEYSDKIETFSGNKKLSKIYEYKPFAVRVVFRILSEDLAYVMLVREKKDDNVTIDREDIIMRDSQVKKQYEELKKLIKDPDKKAKLIEENLKIKERILEFINENSRGQK